MVWTLVAKSAAQFGLDLALIPVTVSKIKNSRETKGSALKNNFRSRGVQKFLRRRNEFGRLFFS